MKRPITTYLSMLPNLKVNEYNNMYELLLEEFCKPIFEYLWL